jgi:hypothetical protein
MRQFLMAALLLLPLAPVAQPQTEPTVRIGLTQNASTVTGRSAMAFTVEQHSTRAATFTTALRSTPRARASAEFTRVEGHQHLSDFSNSLCLHPALFRWHLLRRLDT